MSAARRRTSLLTWVAVLASASAARADLRADELLLVVNGNLPASVKLAEHYARARGVPAGRVLALDLPGGEDISYADYETKIATPVRERLASPAGQGVRCVVTFFGVPLRTGLRSASPADKAESESIKKLLADLDGRAAGLARQMDDAARSIGVTPDAEPVTNVSTARVHIAAMQQKVQSALVGSVDPAKQQAVVEAFKAAQQSSVSAAVEAVNALGPGPANEAAAAPAAVQALLEKPRDAASRAAARRQIARAAGVFALYQVAEQQGVWLNEDDSDASVDNELALVRIPDYPRYRWQPNLLNYRNTADTKAITMVCRIDAPTVEIATKLVEDSIAAERDGLDGKAVFDSRGLATIKNGQPDAYGEFDQTVREAALFVQKKTKIAVVTDDREAIIPPHEVAGVSLYCGWYSLRRYVPSCEFVRGAVGYHVASFELVNLHNPRETGWVANLLREGVVATVGPVSEPYLASFPAPDEMFPLLLTGKPTLAEAYWATCPMTSWKMTLIGDPLYRPFAKRLAVLPSDLSPLLRAWIEKTAAAPAVSR